MPQKRADQYRRKAQECVASAQKAADPGDKINWLTMAESWQRLAERASGGPMIQVSPELIANQELKVSTERVSAGPSGSGQRSGAGE